jgi:excisionase family DNA binding protein
MNNDPLLTVDEVAELLALSSGHVYHLISQKRIPVVRLSARCVRFKRSALDAWIAEMAVPARSSERSQTPINGQYNGKSVRRKGR